MDMNSINGILRAVATARPQLAKADTAFQGASVGQPTEPCLEMHNATPAEYLGQAALVYAPGSQNPQRRLVAPRRLTHDH